MASEQIGGTVIVFGQSGSSDIVFQENRFTNFGLENRAYRNIDPVGPIAQYKHSGIAVYNSSRCNTDTRDTLSAKTLAAFDNFPGNPFQRRFRRRRSSK